MALTFHLLLFFAQTPTPSPGASPAASGVATVSTGATPGYARKKELGAGTPASKAAKDAAKHLGLGTGARGRRVPVTVFISDVRSMS